MTQSHKPYGHPLVDVSVNQLHCKPADSFTRLEYSHRVLKCYTINAHRKL